MKKLFPIAIIIIIIIGFFLFRGKDDPKQFQSYFDQMLSAGEGKDLEKFMDNFSLHYKDDYGTNYIYIKHIVKNTFDKYESFEGVIENLDVSVSKDEEGNKIADTNMDVFVTGYKGGIPQEILGTSGHLDNITVTLQKSSLGKWKIVRVDGVEEAENF